MTTAWDVYRPREYDTDKWIDTVFYDDDCDEDYVRRGLVDHDGYPPDIIVRRQE